LIRLLLSTPGRAVCFAVAILFIDALFYAGSGDPGPRLQPPWDKMAHFVAYGGVTGLIAFADRLERPWLAALIVTALGPLDELMQSEIPGRVADAADIAADWLGVGAALWLLLRVIRPRADQRALSPRS
jgi:VanZ family protein